jgi:hypothetical protein
LAEIAVRALVALHGERLVAGAARRLQSFHLVRSPAVFSIPIHQTFEGGKRGRHIESEILPFLHVHQAWPIGDNDHENREKCEAE